MKSNYIIGLDFGTDSARAVLIDAVSGETIASSCSAYSRWAKGLYCDASLSMYRQHPSDYIEALEEVLSDVVSKCSDPSFIKGISVDATASTPCLVDKTLTPLCLLPEHRDNPDAMFVLWKDHTGEKEAKQIISHAAGTPWLRHNGNTYSPENYWSKVLHTLKSSTSLAADAWMPLELCDFIPALLTGCRSSEELHISLCAASAKGMWDDSLGGWPSREWLTSIDPLLGPIRDRMPKETYCCDTAAGTLCPEWAGKLGLTTGVVIGVGNIDAHSGAVGGGVAYRKMVMSFGTSASYMCVVPEEVMKGRIVEDVFGQAPGIILRGHEGFELGLSSFGDNFAWLRRLLCWAGCDGEDVLNRLSKSAASLEPGAEMPLATDHFNGRRCPAPDGSLTASINGLKLGTSAPELFYAIVEACAFGTKRILDHLDNNGVPVEDIVAIGGIAHKSPFVMQMMADVLNRRMDVSASEQAAALGAAINASVAAGLYPDVASAQKAICPPAERSYAPSQQYRHLIEDRYEKYCRTVEFNESERS